MAELVWISKQLTLAIHSRQLAEHGGLDGVRDVGMLESALARPQLLLSFSADAPTLAQLATAYAFGIAKNHPFVDGNKRTAAVVLDTFIELNGYQLIATDDVMYSYFIKLAEGTIAESEFANWVDSCLRPA